MRIITLTFGPAFDRHCYIADFAAGHEFAAKELSLDAGGKGVNIARALTANGVENEAIVVVGTDNAAAFCAQLDDFGMRYQTIEVQGRIRENLTIHTDNGEETRIAFRGFDADDTVTDRVLEIIGDGVDADTVITLTGRMPQGVSMDALQRMIARLKALGARLVIDSRSFGKADLVQAAPWLIKPNQEEISTYLERPIDTPEQALDGAKELVRSGIGQVLVSMGEQGAMLVTADGVYRASVPTVEVLSTVGAGDSTIAGFLAAMKDGEAIERCLARAVAFGTAACETEGTRPPLAQTVQQRLAAVTVTRM